MDSEILTAPIHSYESMATLDGDGVRFAVFFYGCPLRCVYCHNPDTWCIKPKNYVPSDVLFKKVVRYKEYFKNRGGITFTGGEPLLYAKYITQVNEKLKEASIGYDLDTCGNVALTDDVKKAIDESDLVMLDVKFPTEEEYKKYIKGSLQKTLDTLDYLEKTNKRTWIRIVVVPRLNDTKEKMDEYLKLLNGKKCIESIDLLAFHTMGFVKYEELGIENPLAGYSALDEDVLSSLKQYVNSKWQK